nr:GPI transamidase component GPI16,putative [Plasmodium sp. DRC-Itaito]
MQNRFCHPYIDKHLSERNKNLYKKHLLQIFLTKITLSYLLRLALLIKKTFPTLAEIVAYYNNLNIKPSKNVKKAKRKNVRRFLHTRRWGRRKNCKIGRDKAVYSALLSHSLLCFGLLCFAVPCFSPPWLLPRTPHFPMKGVKGVKGVKRVCLAILSLISLANSHVVDESIHLLPLDNDLLHVKLKLIVNGKSYKENFLPINVLKILNYVKSLKINIKRGVYRSYYNNKYLDNYPFGFTLAVELKERQTDRDYSREKEKGEFSKDEIFLIRQLMNDIWSITGVATNLIKIKNLIKIQNEIFAFLPDESICTEHFSLLKKLYPCKTFGGLFNALSPAYLISKRMSNIGFELHDSSENLLVLYVDFITEHDHKKDVNVVDLINSKYNPNECPLVDRTAILVKKKEENIVSTVFEKYGSFNLVYDNINLYNIVQNGKPNILEEYINVRVLKEEVNSMITADIRKKQSSLLYVFQNLNTKKNSDFLFVDKLPYYLSPLIHTMMIQGKGPVENNQTKDNCNFTFFGYNAIKNFNIKFSNFNTLEKIPKNGNFYYINFKHNLPPQCEIIMSEHAQFDVVKKWLHSVLCFFFLTSVCCTVPHPTLPPFHPPPMRNTWSRFEVIKVQVRSFEFEFDIDRGILLGSGIFVQKRNYVSQGGDEFMYKYTPSLLIDIVLPDTSGFGEEGKRGDVALICR